MTMLSGRLDAATKQSIVCKAAKNKKQDAERKGVGCYHAVQFACSWGGRRKHAAARRRKHLLYLAKYRIIIIG